LGIVAFAGKVILPDRIIADGMVVCKEGRIEYVGRRRKLAKDVFLEMTPDGYVSPGFVDIHVHGGGGADYMDATVDAIRTANHAHARHGTTTVFPTTTSGAPAEISAMIDAVAGFYRNWVPADGARIGGVHLYGPYFNEDKAGCHSKKGCRNPDAAEYLPYFKSGMVKIATCAAELPGAAAFYREARRRNCLVTCGHSDASWPEMAAAFKAGMRHVDHFWCAMSSVPSVRARLGTPMRGSMEQFVLAHDEMSTEVIADGQHLAPELLEFAWKMKGAHRLCLVTDANRALGMPPGKYRFGNKSTGTWFESDGKVGSVKGVGLASSVVPLERMIQIMRRDTSAPLEAIIRMASLTPAERAGVDTSLGSLAPGKHADIVLLDKRLKVRKTIIGAGA
jgi:N-acetylglucosamine-6-phosphate deacetylase